MRPRQIPAPALLICTALALGAAPARSGPTEGGQLPERMTVYYSWSDRAAGVMLDAFERRAGVKVERMRRSSRAIIKILELEKAKPVASVLMGGTLPGYVMGADAGVFAPYAPAGHERYTEDQRDAEYRWHAILGGVIGFGTNPETGLSPPRSWEDLLDPRFEGRVLYGDPTTSGTGYTILASLIALMGEDEAFDYLGRLDRNVAYYPEGGAIGADLVRLGIGGVAVAFVHDLVATTPRRPGARLDVTVPSEGTGWELGGCALVAGGPNPELGRRLLDFLLGADAQELLWREAEFPLYPLHPDAAPPPGVPVWNEVKRIAVDWRQAGRDWDRRARRWSEMIGERREGGTR